MKRLVVGAMLCSGLCLCWWGWGCATGGGGGGGGEGEGEGEPTCSDVDEACDENTACCEGLVCEDGACVAAGGGGETIDVAIENFAFTPAAVTVNAGDTVRWTNLDAAPHTVTSGNPGDQDAGAAFDSATMNEGDVFEFTFQDAGDFVYFCEFHAATMRDATVTVEP